MFLIELSELSIEVNKVHRVQIEQLLARMGFNKILFAAIGYNFFII